MFSSLTKASTPRMVLIRARLKQVVRVEASVFTPFKPLRRDESTFKLRLICPKGSSTFGFQNLQIS